MFIKGKILSSHGVIGYAKVKSVSNNFNDFLKLKNNNILLKKDGYNSLDLVVEDLKIKDNLLLIKFLGIDVPEKIKSLIGYEIWVEDDLASSLDNDEYYYGELIGFKIVNSENIAVAEVVSFLESNTNILLEVKKEDKVFLIPFLDVYLGKIDRNKKTIEIKILELLE